jgi:hypothetical protein
MIGALGMYECTQGQLEGQSFKVYMCIGIRLRFALATARQGSARLGFRVEKLSNISRLVMTEVCDADALAGWWLSNIGR